MNLESLEVRSVSASGHRHLVEFYETEEFLVDTVGSFLVPALREGDAAIVVATPAHRQKFDAALADAGIDVDAIVREGRYLAFDAAAVLERFMVDGQPDVTRFRETIGAVMDGASAGGRQVRVYGEMVALLWDDGDTASALALEDLWNDLAEIRSFMLLCAYPMSSFGEEASSKSFKRVCEQHTTVIPTEGYSLRIDPAERSRAVAQLQQQIVVLKREVVRLRRHHGRDEAGGHRDEAGGLRDQAGGLRDQAGDRRDQAGDERNQAAEQRDEAAEQRDEAAERSEASAHPAMATGSLSHSALARREAASDRRRASQDRRAGARERRQSKLDRDIALADRGAGASERTDAEFDRTSALADRGASARERDQASHDDLTGAYLRGAGFVELERDMARARRSEQPLVVAFIDVDHLKAINDSGGHAAGDRMLREVAKTFRGRLRSHDLIIRYGGDEFICAISGLALAEATKRLAHVQAALAEGPEHGSVTIGIAQLQQDDSAEDLVERADAALYRERQSRNRLAPRAARTG